MKNTKSATTNSETMAIPGINPALFLWLGLIAAGLLFTGCVSAPPATIPQKVRTTVAPQPAYVPPVPVPLTPEQQLQKDIAQREADAANAKAARETEIANAKAAAARDPLNWRVFNELGTVYYKQGMYDQAIAAFQQALALHPITNVIEAERKQEEAIAAQQAAQEAQRQAAIQRAKEQAQQQSMNDMLGLISGIAGVKGNMGAQLAVNTLASVNQSLNSSAAEVPTISPAEKAESSLKDKREIASIYANLGMAYFGKKSYPQSVAALDNVTQLDPSRTEVLKVSAEAQYNLCQYEDCITTLTRYHAIAPVESATLLLLSDAYRALGMGPEADKAFGAFLGRHKITSTDSVELLKVGTLCLSHYHYAEAAEYLARVQQIAKGSPESARKLNEAQLSLMLAAAQFGLSQATNAIPLLGEVTLKGANPRAWYMLGRCYDEIGNREKASEAYRKALETFGTTTSLASVDNYIQVCRAATGAGDEAIEALKNKLTSVPLTPGGGVDQWCFLGFAYEKTGRTAEAIEILNRCRDANSTYAWTEQALERLGSLAAPARDQALAEADAALKAGNKEQAVKQLAEAYRLAIDGPKKEEIRKAMLKLVAGMDPVPSLTGEAQDHFLRGNAALKAAKSPTDLGRSLSEFEWAVYYSPWAGELYFNTSAVKKLQNQVAAAVSDLKLYLAAYPNAKNLEELLNRLYEFDYQREQKLRELAAGATF
jgi:tetratricopeptide (TPR) repeat protein